MQKEESHNSVWRWDIWGENQNKEWHCEHQLNGGNKGWGWIPHCCKTPRQACRVLKMIGWDRLAFFGWHELIIATHRMETKEAAEKRGCPNHDAGTWKQRHKSKHIQIKQMQNIYTSCMDVGNSDGRWQNNDKMKRGQEKQKDTRISPGQCNQNQETNAGQCGGDIWTRWGTRMWQTEEFRVWWIEKADLRAKQLLQQFWHWKFSKLLLAASCKHHHNEEDKVNQEEKSPQTNQPCHFYNQSIIAFDITCHCTKILFSHIFCERHASHLWQSICAWI